MARITRWSVLALVLSLCIPSIAIPATVELGWNAVPETPTASVQGYKLYRGSIPCSDVGPLAFFADVGKVLSFRDTTVPDTWTNVCYEVTAHNTKGDSGRSNRAGKALTVATVLPASPTNFRYDAGTIRWDAVLGATGGYFLRVHEAGTPYNPCSAMTYCNETVGSLMTTSLVLPLKAGTLYDMWIHSVAADGTMSTSVGSSFTTPIETVPPAPTGLRIVSSSAQEIIVVASISDCSRVITSTKGSTSTQLKRTMTCVR